MCKSFRLVALLFLWGVRTDGVRMAAEETQQKALKPGEADVTDMCPNHTLSDILSVICNRSGEYACRVYIRFDQQGIYSTCDSRVTLQNVGGRVFLNITNIQPSDEGSYTCECVYNGGTDHMYLNISIKASPSLFLTLMITGFTAFVVIMIFTGIFMKKVHLRRAQKKVCNTFNNVTETIYMDNQQQNIEPYDTFTRKDCTLYSTLQLTNPNP